MHYPANVRAQGKPSPRFFGTVTDKLTGLIWLKNANCFSYKIWTNALAAANGLASGSCGLTDGSLASDWRLPNINELKSLTDFSQPSVPLPPGHPFTNVPSFYYWSSTTFGNSPTMALRVYTFDWAVSFEQKTTNGNVWPVRGGQ
ncbi:MAG: DUF1566 domain-containing protein, partial [Deltaproteobacteria bacterium]|nr:DUF1566 domain-containing protein [Deltaproteobacteria bacterium]